jgi:hypothetical protein
MRGNCLMLLVAVAPWLSFASGQVEAAAPGASADSPKARWSPYGIPDGREPSGTSCGLNSVYTALRDLRVDAAYDVVQAQMPAGIYGNTMTQIVNCLREYPGVEVTPLNCDAHQLSRHLRGDRSGRAIVNLIDHWVLVRRATSDALEIVDFPKKYFMPIGVLDSQWDGYAVIVRRTGILTHRAILGSSVALLCTLGIVGVVVQGIHRKRVAGKSPNSRGSDAPCRCP